MRQKERKSIGRSQNGTITSGEFNQPIYTEWYLKIKKKTKIHHQQQLFQGLTSLTTIISSANSLETQLEIQSQFCPELYFV